MLLVAPVLAWALREGTRPAGLAGLLVGAALGQVGLLALAQVRCAGASRASQGIVETCSSPDLAPYSVVAGLVGGVGLALTASVIARWRRRTVV